jgi:hypothetical protein
VGAAVNGGLWPLTEEDVEALRPGTLVMHRCPGCKRDWWEEREEALIDFGLHHCPNCGAAGGDVVGYRYCRMCEDTYRDLQAIRAGRPLP